jgi:Cyclic-phosphate processing Receiver domain
VDADVHARGGDRASPPGSVTELSLDHDLGLDDGVSERTGCTVLLWLEMEVGTGRWIGPLPEISVHSGNSAGRDRMLRVIRTIHRLHAMAAARVPEIGPRGSI